jgi:hypothetical protein
MSLYRTDISARSHTTRTFSDLTEPRALRVEILPILGRKSKKNFEVSRAPAQFGWHRMYSLVASDLGSCDRIAAAPASDRERELTGMRALLHMYTLWV